jgi:hypothetical protein
MMIAHLRGNDALYPAKKCKFLQDRRAGPNQGAHVDCIAITHWGSEAVNSIAEGTSDPPTVSNTSHSHSIVELVHYGRPKRGPGPFKAPLDSN